MATLYIRDVAPAVAEKLKERASSEGTSLSAYVSSELAKIAARPTNAEIVAELCSLDRSGAPTVDDVVAAVHVGRNQR